VRTWLITFVAGALAALALPPFNLWPLLAAFAVLLLALRRSRRRRDAAVLGWWFGFGHFLAGLYWIAIAFFSDAERFGALAIPAVLLLCAGLALFAALAAWLAVLRRWQSVTASALALALAWTASEVLRAYLFTGFPWNLIGYAWVDTPVAQLAALTSVYGQSALGVALGALPAVLIERGVRAGWRPLAAGVAVLGLVWLGGALRLADAEVAPVADVRLRLVQGNVAQHHKWDPELRARWFQRHLELSTSPGDGISHVVWPESATPYALAQDATARAMIAEIAPQGGLVLTGGERFDLDAKPPTAWNSLFVLDDAGTIVARYDKRDLVPFGEFLPLRALLGRLGLEKLTRGSIDFRPGPGRATLELPGLPPVSPLICYEVIFPGEVVAPGAGPAWLLNVTNDAWFGQSSGPYQHLAMARVRAIEEGIPLVRSANTGISAVIDPFGRERARLGLGETGVLDAGLPQALDGRTPFARYRFWPLALLACALAVALVVLETHAMRTLKR